MIVVDCEYASCSHGDTLLYTCTRCSSTNHGRAVPFNLVVRSKIARQRANRHCRGQLLLPFSTIRVWWRRINTLARLTVKPCRLPIRSVFYESAKRKYHQWVLERASRIAANMCKSSYIVSNRREHKMGFIKDATFSKQNNFESRPNNFRFQHAQSHTNLSTCQCTIGRVLRDSR